MKKTKINGFAFILAVLLSALLLWRFGVSSASITEKAKEIWIQSDYQLFVKPALLLNTLEQEKALHQHDFSGFHFVIKLLKNNGVETDAPLKIFAKTQAQELFLVATISDSVLFDDGIAPFLNQVDTLPNVWKKINNTHFQIKRVGNNAILFYGKTSHPQQVNLFDEDGQNDMVKNLDDFSSNSSSLMLLQASKTYLKNKKLSTFSVVLNKMDKLNVTIDLSSKENVLPALKNTAWGIKNQEDTNYISMSFNPKKIAQFVHLFLPEINWINPNFQPKIKAFLKAWEGDLFLMMGKEKEAKTIEIVTEMDENFNLTEEKIIHETKYQNNILAVSYNEYWSSFENIITSKPHPKKHQQTAQPHKEQDFSFQLPKTAQKSTQTARVNDVSLRNMNLSKKNGFVVFHGAPKCPKLIESKPKTDFFYAPFRISLNKATQQHWEISAIME